MKHLSIFIALLYLALPIFSQNLVYSRGENGKLGYCDVKTRKLVIPYQFDDAAVNFSEGLAAVNINGNWGYIDNTGKIVIPLQFEKAYNFSDGLANIMKNGKYGYIDKTGNVVIPPQYLLPGDFHEGLADVTWNYGDYGFIDKTGKVVITNRSYSFSDFSEGLCAIKNERDDKYGFMDKTGKIVIPCIFDDAGNFSEGLSRVKSNGKFGYIDKTGKVVIPLQFEEAYDFENGYASVYYKAPDYLKSGQKRIYIDIKGNVYDNEKDAQASSERLKTDMEFNMSFKNYLAREGCDFSNICASKGVITSEDEFKGKIQSEVTAWQKKGEFEPTAAYRKRVNEETRKVYAAEVAKRLSDENNRKLEEAKKSYKEQFDKIAGKYCDGKSELFAKQEFTLRPYDADNQAFLISTSKYGDILLPIPLDKAPAFKSDWERIKKSVKAKFVPVGEDVALQSVAFGPYVYDSSTKATYAQVDVADNFRPIDISSLDLSFGAIDDVAAAPAVSTTPVLSKREVTPERTKIEVGSSDVDVNIPSSGRKAANTFAVIIANKDYQHASKVNNAANDGRVMEQYLNLTLGLPKENITTCIDATYGQINSALRHLQDIGRAYRDEEFNVIFYYVGHGLPDDENRESYILPVDVDPRDTRVCYPLKEVYSLLGGLGAKNVTVMIDACFSGANHGDGMLMADAMAVAIKPKETNPMGNTVVLAAAQGDETAYPYAEKSHGLFTYWLLKKLQETKGDVTLGELSDYVKDKVFKTSTVINHKPQTPSVSTSPSLATTWRTLPFSR